jgi:hypothetical protein
VAFLFLPTSFFMDFSLFTVDGAELTGENIVDVGVSFPGNGARK